jgi:hypothetical protein
MAVEAEEAAGAAAAAEVAKGEIPEARELVLLFSDAEKGIVSVVQEGFTQDLRRPRVRRTLMGRIRRAVDRVRRLLSVRARAVVEASNGHGVGLVEADLFDRDVEFSRINREGVAILVDNMVRALGDSLQTVGRQAEDLLRREGLRIATEQLLREAPVIDAAARLRRRLERGGITGFTDRAGRNWDLSTYAKMVVQTTTAEAQARGTLNAMVAKGLDLVKIPEHPGSCPICRPLEGKVYSITGLTSGYPVFPRVWPPHPNCRHPVLPAIDAFDVGGGGAGGGGGGDTGGQGPNEDDGPPFEWVVRDEKDREVSLGKRRFAEHIEVHPDRRFSSAAVRRAILSGRRHRDRYEAVRDGWEEYWIAGPGPSKWLFVAVRFIGDRGYVRTAIPRRDDPDTPRLQ